jgi:hypothetical protein
MHEWVKAENPCIEAALIIRSHVIELDRLAFPMGYNVANAPGTFIPREYASLATKNQSAALVEGHATNMFARRNHGLDSAVGTAPVNAAQHHI